MQGTNVLFGQIAVVFGIVIAGVWGATQWTAAALGYQVRLGSPWFDFLGTSIYHPWKLFEWWFFFGAYAPEVFDTGGAIAGASGMVAVGVAIAMSVWRSRQARLVTTYGSARWANAQDIRKAAHAQWVVVDPTNLVQNTLTAIRTLEQINNQIQQLQNEAQMLMNQARNLASLPSSVVNQLRANLATTERLIAQARGLAYDVTNLDREFARLYPEQYAATVSGDQMYRDAQERWRNTLNGLQTTMQMQAQVSQNLGEDEGVLADLVGKSQSAEGALQAMQAMNQLLALQAKQSIQSQRLQITQDRAASLELARQAAATERAREVRRRFLGEGTPYTPQSVNFYGN